MAEYKPFNQEKDPGYNREPGVVLVPGSNFVKEVAKFEQFPSKYTVGTVPGNPYVKREFPKMLYRAEHYHGKAACMAAPPDPIEFPPGREFEHADEAARKFSEKCQREVNDEREMSRAMEDGWRESPKEAVEYLRGRERDRSTAEAHRNYEDRNMSDLAKREIAEEREARGGEHIVSMPEKRRRRGRPKGSKNAPKR